MWSTVLVLFFFIKFKIEGKTLPKLLENLYLFIYLLWFNYFFINQLLDWKFLCYYEIIVMIYLFLLYKKIKNNKQIRK